jgi:antitoxin Phd
MRTWQVQDAKVRFSELLEASLKEGPQVVTRRGVEAAVLVPIEQWRRLERPARPTLKELLLGEGPRFEPLVPRPAIAPATIGARRGPSSRYRGGIGTLSTTSAYRDGKLNADSAPKLRHIPKIAPTTGVH